MKSNLERLGHHQVGRTVQTLGLSSQCTTCIIMCSSTDDNAQEGLERLELLGVRLRLEDAENRIMSDIPSIVMVGASRPSEAIHEIVHTIPIDRSLRGCSWPTHAEVSPQRVFDPDNSSDPK